jgi:hypothetical protein
MKFFGEARNPRRNIGVAALMVGLTSFSLGAAYERVFSPETTTNDWIDFAIWFVLTVLAGIGIRRSIVAALPTNFGEPHPRRSRMDGPAV